MAECDYCDASFDDEDAYLAHLRDAHEGELGAIDRKRVEGLDGDGGGSMLTGPVVLGLVLALSVGLVVYVTLFMGGGNAGTGTAPDLPDSGDPAVISEVQTEPSTGNAHVASGTDVDYETIPPTSGAHWGREWMEAGFYEQRQPLEKLVHSLEHGAVVVYYDPDRLSPDAGEHLRSYAGTHTRQWQRFVAVPHPEDDPGAAYVLTAWEKRLTLEEYDPDAVEAFTAEYLGRGPEQPVR